VTKSIGAEETFPRDLHERGALERELVRLADKVGARLRHSDVVARTLTLKVRFADFTTITRARTLVEPTATSSTIAMVARELLTPIDVTPGIRLLGISGSQLSDDVNTQGVLALDGLDERDAREMTERRAAVERAVDAVRDRFGDGALQAATLVSRESEDGA
jgi:DNA polymerase-4